MTRKAAWVAQLSCVACDHRSRYVNGAARECPECGRFLRMELKRRPVPDEPYPERSIAAWPARKRERSHPRDDTRRFHKRETDRMAGR
jgi:ssDNA-binding Zn-finger/Zn-ribbon topoisomerase 1